MILFYRVRWKGITSRREEELSVVVDGDKEKVELFGLQSSPITVWVTAATKAGEGEPSEKVTVSPTEKGD